MRIQARIRFSDKSSSITHQNSSHDEGQLNIDQYSNTDEGKALYARKVLELHPLWIHILNFFSINEYDCECLDTIKRCDNFRKLSQAHPVPDDLLKEVFKRKNIQGKNSKRELSPLGFTLEHARRVIGLSEKYKFKYETLIEFYHEGRRLSQSNLSNKYKS